MRERPPGESNLWLVLFCGISMLLGLTAITVAQVDVPDDVIQRAQLAQANMYRIYVVLATYANDNNNEFPPDLRMLYPHYISDPAVFWHPGDSDPRPDTIDNDQPDALNSTRISYEYADSLDAPCDEPLIRDNSARNNGGYFISMVHSSGRIYTDPPFATPNLSRREAARHNLQALSRSLFTYVNQNNSTLPLDPILTIDYVCWPYFYWNPGDTDPLPTVITNSVPNAINSAQISFEFLHAGEDMDRLPPDTIVIRDNTPANNEGQGIFVARADGRVDFITLCNDPFADADWDGDVDQEDFGILQRCLGSVAGAPDPRCFCFDRAPPAGAAADGLITQADVQAFQACASGPALPADSRCDNP